MRLIDADEMLKRAETWNTEDWMDKALYNFTRDRIIEQPTVDADPVKRGRWVEQEHGDWKWSKEYRCSECGQYRLVTTPVGREWNYCPSCGAKMAERGDR